MGPVSLADAPDPHALDRDDQIVALMQAMHDTQDDLVETVRTLTAQVREVDERTAGIVSQLARQNDIAEAHAALRSEVWGCVRGSLATKPAQGAVWLIVVGVASKALGLDLAPLLLHFLGLPI